MDTQRFRSILQAKERDLIAEIARLEQEARQSQEAEVQDPIDRVTSDEAKAASLESSTIEYAVLQQVRDALRRIDAGTYGVCVDCGRAIPEARLEAVPWTPYCRDDQEKHDGEARRSDLLDASS